MSVSGKSLIASKTTASKFLKPAALVHDIIYVAFTSEEKKSLWNMKPGSPWKTTTIEAILDFSQSDRDNLQGEILERDWCTLRYLQPAALTLDERWIRKSMGEPLNTSSTLPKPRLWMFFQRYPVLPDSWDHSKHAQEYADVHLNRCFRDGICRLLKPIFRVFHIPDRVFAMPFKLQKAEVLSFLT